MDEEEPANPPPIILDDEVSAHELRTNADECLRERRYENGLVYLTRLISGENVTGPNAVAIPIDFLKRAICFQLLRRFEEAVDDSTHGLSLSRQFETQIGLSELTTDEIFLHKFVAQELYLRRADCLSELSHFHRCIRDCTLGLRIAIEMNNVRFRRVLLNLRGWAHRSLLNYRAAAEDYTELLRLIPQDALTLYNRGSCWDEMGMPHRAIEDYDVAMTRENPPSAALVNNRAYSYITIGEFAKGLEDLDRLLEAPEGTYPQIDDDWMSKLLWRRSLSLCHMGRFDEATVDLNHSYALDPEFSRFALSMTEVEALAPDFLEFSTKMGQTKAVFELKLSIETHLRGILDKEELGARIEYLLGWMGEEIELCCSLSVVRINVRRIPEWVKPKPHESVFTVLRSCFAFFQAERKL